MPHNGSCLCGSVKYEMDALENDVGHCHCTMCRKFHGAAFATFGEIKKENFRWTAGEDLLIAYVADNGTTRRFCRRCGSSMTFESAGNPRDVVEIALGTLDDDISQRPDSHIYVAHKANWHDIADSLPQHAEGRHDGE